MDPEQKDQLLEEIELLDGASAEFDQEMVSKGRTDSCILWISSYQLWCRDIPGAFPENDHIPSSKNGRLRPCRSYER